MPRGSQKPRGAWAPISLSNPIVRAELRTTRDTGAKAAAEARVVKTEVLRLEKNGEEMGEKKGKECVGLLRLKA
jgi:hypothetical protein